jgi:maltose/moltooligosaccharide transporter
LWTVISSDELPPENIEEWKLENSQSKGMYAAIGEITKGIFSMPKTMGQLAVVQFFTWACLIFLL